MKIIQDRELIRITKMMQGDHEMRDLAVTSLSKKRFRFNFWTIIVFHFILFELTLMSIIYLCYQFHFGLFWIPAVMLAVAQAIFSLSYLATMWDFRAKYSETRFYKN